MDNQPDQFEPEDPALPLLNELARFLCTARDRSSAITAGNLAALCLSKGHSVDARRVREVIAHYYAKLNELVGGVIVAEAPHGYWRAGSDAELQARERLLWSLEREARAKRLLFVREVQKAGLGRLMPDREKEREPEPTFVAASAEDSPQRRRDAEDTQEILP